MTVTHSVNESSACIKLSLRRIWVPYTVEGLANLGYSLLSVGIFFYMRHHFGWELLQNLLLASALGFVYMMGSLLSRYIALKIGLRRGLISIYLLLTLLALCGLAGLSVYALTGILVLYTFIASCHSPLLQGMVSKGTDVGTLSRRISMYNLVWSGVGAITFAFNGLLIAYWPAGIFIMPALAHALSVLLLISLGEEPAAMPANAKPAVEIPEQFTQNRLLALRLARVSLPATYIVVYSLLATMPSLPLLQDKNPAMQTFLSSIWMAARWLSFLLLGMTIWWHKRPRILFAAAVVMLVGFATIVFQTGSSHIPVWMQIGWMICCQVALGAALGMIYSGSLYFGMALSKGSVAHGGYHEALLGFGAILGPGSGALALYAAPEWPRLCLIVIAGLIGMIVLSAGVVCLRSLSKKAF